MERPNVVFSLIPKQLAVKLFIAFLFVGGISFGQSTPKITVFKPEDNSPTSLDKVDRKAVQNNLKWNFCLIPRGVFLFNYEYYLNPKLTAEAGFGLTYRDFIFEVAKTFGAGFSFLDQSEFTPNVKYAVELGIRFYPKGFDYFEGVYVSPMISYRTYDFNVVERNSYYTYTPTAAPALFKPGYDFLDLQFKIGYQYESYWDYDLTGDFYTGFALRNTTVNYYTEDASSGNNIVRAAATLKEKYPQFLFGFKIGVPF